MMATPPMVDPELEELREAYKQATDEWVIAIRAEESLATPDHSMVAMEHWDQAEFREKEAQEKVKIARNQYKDALRRINYGI
jgi:hypothetical protein